MLKNAKKPKKYNIPKKKISKLKDLWIGEELFSVRKKHFEKKINDLDVCKNCSFKDTYAWKKNLKNIEFIAEIASSHNGSIKILKKI